MSVRVLLALLCCLYAGAPDVHVIANVNLLQTQLPFPIATHPLQLSLTLFAGDEPHVDDQVDLKNKNTVDAVDPKKTLLADVPFPTGAWWTNLVLDRGDVPVVTMPYVFRILNEKLHVSYPFRVVTPQVIQSGFLSQVVVSAGGGDSHVMTHHVVGFDSFSTQVRFSRDKEEAFTVHLVRGSPYVTMEFTNSIPVIESMDGLLISRFKQMEDLVFMNGEPVDFATFSIMLNNGQTWYIYASDPSLKLTFSDGKVTSDTPYTGVLRIAFCLDASAQPFLQEFAGVYPVEGKIQYNVDPSNDVANVKLHWKTRYFSSKYAEDKLLMLALPHHMDILAKDSKTDVTTNEVLGSVWYTSIRGMMQGIIGNVWHMQEVLPNVEWDFANDGVFDEGKTSETVAAEREQVTKKILSRLPEEIEKYPVLSPNSYNFGKQVGREARLLLIADRFNQKDLVDRILTKIKAELIPWLEATNGDNLVYDQTFGGVVTKDGLRDQDSDFGNGYYNDHHFHYGYFIYALAIVRKFDPDFINSHATACAMLVADIGAPLDPDTPFFHDFPARNFFPIARHKDWFVGHSYASGMFPMEVGKSQESSSESVNAYYALALFSSLDKNANEATSYHQYARLLLAAELRSTKKYWQMQENSKIYEPVFSKNMMIGVVGEMSVAYNTWFGDRPMYMHGINMIPFTPITTQLLEEAYVASEFRLLSDDLQSLDGNNIWRSVIVLDHAILDAQSAWEEFTTTVQNLDTWNSYANSLLWIATRPSWTAKANVKELIKEEQNGDDKCFGYPACSVAGDNGTALNCCSTLPGCCPSALGCCPKQDVSEVPLNACFGEHECAILGLGCCNTIDGCCEPDPISGTVLGCCKNQHPKAKPVTAAVHSLDDSANCYNEPLCAAAHLDCCAAPGGCCLGPTKLDCCSAVTASSVGMESNDTTDPTSCHGEPQCALDGLDCCRTLEGCCLPDPLTGEKLGCCLGADSSANNVPIPSAPSHYSTCHENPRCLTAGENGTTLACCFTPEGCCPGLSCCSSEDDSEEVQSKSKGNETTSRHSHISKVAIGLIVVGAIGALAFSVFMFRRRRNYTPIDGGSDMRAYLCAGMMVVLLGFFIFLILKA